MHTICFAAVELLPKCAPLLAASSGMLQDKLCHLVLLCVPCLQLESFEQPLTETRKKPVTAQIN